MKQYGIQIILLLVLAGFAGRAGAVIFQDEQERDRESQRERDRLRRELLESDTLEHVSGAGAFFRSLAVPGWGQAALARTRPEIEGSGRMQFYVDLGLAVLTTGLVRYGEIKRGEYQAYAAQAAGVSDHPNGSDFWVDVSNYESRESYNEAMLSTGRPFLRYLDPEDHWEWASREQRARYRDLRAVSEDALSRALAVGGAMLLNHVLSAVHALRLSRGGDLPELQAFHHDGRAGLALCFSLAP